MKQILTMASIAMIALTLAACGAEGEQVPQGTTDAAKNNETEAVSAASAAPDATTSASIVPDEFIQDYQPAGFSDSDVPKAIFVLGDPRPYSVTTDLAVTAMKHFEAQGVEVELRDLYAMDWNPVLSRDEFYYQKDGHGEPSEEVRREQELILAADHIVFVYPNWHDTQNAIVKGYMERVFAKTFAYENTADGLDGLLDGRTMFTINNCGFLGGGRGYIGDGVGIDNEAWDRYMRAFQVLDNDTAGFWDVESKGRFVNDRTPANNSDAYQSEINTLRDDLTAFLNQVYFS